MIDRLQKKCIIASAGLHSLLIGLLLFGSALMPKPQEPAFVPIKVYDSKQVSMVLASGGGSPDAVVPPTPLPQVTPPQPQPPQVKPQPEPPKPKPVEPAAIPEPPKIIHHDPIKERAEIPKPEKVKPTKPVKEEVAEPPKPVHKIEIPKDSLKAVSRKHNDEAAQAQAAADAKARAERKRIGQQIASTARNISKNMSSSTLVELTPGIGTPGEVSVNYRDLIASKYYNAWSAPTDLDDSTTPIVSVSLTIGRDGNVKSARIVTPSGNRAMDRSIQNVLETVTSFEPFPPGTKDEEKTFTIRFNLQAKRGTG